MNRLTYNFELDGLDHAIEMIFVEGTPSEPYFFGSKDNPQPIHITSFYISKYQVTQAVWRHFMDGSDPSHFKDARRPVENVSFYDITGPGGFLERLNASGTPNKMSGPAKPEIYCRFRLPSETEWEYAARGGIFWKDDFEFSGSNDIDTVAWYLENSGRMTHPAGEKASNQIGVHDMCGNVWEWCEDLMVRDVALIPKNGRPYLVDGTDRILRGGCHHNGPMHSTVYKRYEIVPDAADECIGFRIVLSG